MDYSDYLKTKELRAAPKGFAPLFMPDYLFDFQKQLVDWAIRLGRAALFCECGLGKSIQQLVWAENIIRKHPKSRVLVVTPLAVSGQTVREAEKFGLKAYQTQEGKLYPGINVTNYDRLKNYRPEDFIGAVGDESSILKNFEGQMRKAVTQFFSKVNYRLLCTATPAPNDFMELGTSSEALGSMTRSQMLAMFFTNGGDSTQDWEIKGHARRKFWRWVSTWARAVRKPSDLGFEDGDFALPPLNIHKHEVPSTLDYGKGGFFKTPARTLEDQRKERKNTLKARCEKVASLVPDKGAAIVWCHLNDEGNLLTKLIPGAVEVCGADKDSVKEDRLLGFSEGKYRVLVTKPKIAGFGLNWQHCRNVFYFPNHSHEQYYQAIRRCWRFGQKKPVECHLVSSEAETLVVQNMLRKEKQSEILYAGIVQEINTAVHEDNKRTMNKMEIPTWL